MAHDLGDEVSGRDVETGDADFSITRDPEGGGSRSDAVRPLALGVVAGRRHGEADRPHHHPPVITDSVAVGVQPESVLLTPSERTLVVSLRGSPATVAFVDARRLTLIGTLQIAGAGTFGDLAVMTGDGHYVYATFDAGIPGTGGVAVVDVRMRRVVETWAYPGTGRPHGIWYSRKKLRL